MSNPNSLTNCQSTSSQDTWDPDKIWHVVQDIQDSPKISLPSLLTVILARLLIDVSDVDIENCEILFSEKVKQSKDIVEMMRQDAEAFCNDEDNIRSTETKKLLREYCTQKNDNCRRAKLCNALNTILSEYRNKKYGDLSTPSPQGEKEEFIFIPNDLEGLESDHIAQQMSSSKRRPDILAMYTSTLRETFKGHIEAEFDDWVRIISDNRNAEPSSSTGRLRWPDVHQTWEVATSGLFDAAAFEENDPDIEKAMMASKSLDRSPSSQHPNSRKRRSEEELPRRSKKARIESEPESKTFLQQVTGEQFNLLPELRCAYYAIERLSSAWYITHGTTIQIEDTRLLLRWYDAQGCFQSEAIDIIDEMPIFIVMLIIFQRFNKRLWGLDTEKVGSGNDTFEPDRSARCRFELKDRRTFASSAVRVAESGVANTKDAMPLFYKSSWVKCVDLKEPDTINTAHDRANTLLPENFRKMVTDHIPTVIASQVCNKSATSTIRLLVREVEDSAQFKEEDIRKRARVRVWLVTRKLDPIHDLEPSDFWRVFWEILRCHYLLWKIGIAHRDVSITNLMCATRDGSLSGVLNDYDLATVMEPGSRCPGGDDYDYAGTTPFMAVDLLEYREAKRKRWYRYDLESFIWCLSWEMLESPPRTWSEGKLDAVFTSKKSSMVHSNRLWPKMKEKWLSVFHFTFTWFDSWRRYLRCIDLDLAKRYKSSTDMHLSDSEVVALRDVEDAKKEDKEYVELVIEAAKAVDFSKDVDVIQDSSWVSVELLR